MPSREVVSLELVSDSAGFVIDHLWAIVIIVVGLGLLVLSCRIRRRSTTTDPLRDFASHEYKAGMARAGHRCEMPKLLGRCDAGDARPMVTTSSPGRRAGHRWLRTSSPRALHATWPSPRTSRPSPQPCSLRGVGDATSLPICHDFRASDTTGSRRLWLPRDARSSRWLLSPRSNACSANHERRPRGHLGCEVG